MDSSIGGIPSPILPDGSFCSLPIPELDPHSATKGTPYERIRVGDATFGSLVSQLTGGRISEDAAAHLDPDLDPLAIDREPGWRPVFGQAGPAESHLVAAGVGPGDLFLFFGWFRQTVLANGRLRFEKGAPDIHALFGWLQIGERLSLTRGDPPPPWAVQHPHCLGKPYASQDSLYISAEHLDLPGIAAGTIAGGGVGRRYSSSLSLTAPSENRSVWLLPEWFRSASPAASCLTYHRNPARWRPSPSRPGHVLLRTVGRGQEFILDLPDSSEASIWVADKIRALQPESTAFSTTTAFPLRATAPRRASGETREGRASRD